jgi:leader peptidase (prepilin peptidase)/N-methyltransferase
MDGLPQFTTQAWILPIVQPLFWLIVGVIAVAIIISDLEQLVIPRWSIIWLTMLTLIYRIGLVVTGEMQAIDFWLAIVWALLLGLSFFGLWWLTHGRGFGFGDVQLAFPLALLLASWQRIIVGIWLGFFSGALVGVVLILLKKKRFGQVIPFGPFLLLGTALSLRWGWQLWDSYVRLIVE